MTNNRKQKSAPFCALAHAARPAFPATFATGQRQNDRIMSPQDGTPAATTKCKRLAGNDLRANRETSPKQYAKTPSASAFCPAVSTIPRQNARSTWAADGRQRTNKKRTRLALRGCQPDPPVKREQCPRLRPTVRRSWRRVRAGSVGALPTALPGGVKPANFP
jgi:hypothetical protein